VWDGNFAALAVMTIFSFGKKLPAADGNFARAHHRTIEEQSE